MIRGKFVVEGKYEQYPGNHMVILQCRYDESLPEDQSFSKATPYGHIQMAVSNPAAAEQFKIGQAFYVDFTPVG